MPKERQYNISVGYWGSKMKYPHGYILMRLAIKTPNVRVAMTQGVMRYIQHFGQPEHDKPIPYDPLGVQGQEVGKQFKLPRPLLDTRFRSGSSSRAHFNTRSQWDLWDYGSARRDAPGNHQHKWLDHPLLNLNPLPIEGRLIPIHETLGECILDVEPVEGKHYRLLNEHLAWVDKPIGWGGLED